MSTINILGIDIGKSTFHLVGHDSSGQEIFRKKLSRPKLIQFLANTERTTVAMESCGGSHWLLRCSQNGNEGRKEVGIYSFVIENPSALEWASKLTLRSIRNTVSLY
jgi:hypothetical protein